MSEPMSYHARVINPLAREFEKKTTHAVFDDIVTADEADYK